MSRAAALFSADAVSDGAHTSARRRERIPLKLIDVRDRLRDVDPDWASALAISIERDGLISPIEVRPVPGGRFRLVIGGHRLAAHHMLGLADIDAEIVTQSALAARAREIAENVMRRELSALDRAAFIAELYEIERQRVGLEEGEDARRLGADKRWAKDASAKIAQASGLSDAVALKVGLAKRSVYLDLALFRALNPGARSLLAQHPVTENAAQLRLLAKSPDQLKIAHMLQAGEAKSVADAIAMLHPKAAPTEASKAWSAFLGGWERLGTKQRRQALELLVDKGLPAGIRIVFDGIGNG